MFGSEAIEVGIGMSLLFLFMSLIATALREAIENRLRGRSKDLETGIGELLRGGHDGIVKELYNHPLISSLYKGVYGEPTKGLTSILKGGDLPSYIPRQNFSLALLDIIAKASQTATPLSISSLRASIAASPAPNDLQRVVLTAIDTANGDLDQVRKAIEDWYDGTMDRVSGWYTRRTGVVLFFLGFAAAMVFNVDTITVAQSLIRDKSLRDAVVAQAESTVDATKQSAPAKSDAAGTPQVGAQATLPSVTELKARLDQVGFPIGWTHQGELINIAGLSVPALYPTPQACRLSQAASPDADPVATCSRSGWILSTLFGWLITALAIMLGAPFWFDVLNKFMVVRSTIKPKEKSPDEASPDRQAKPVIVAGHAVSGDGGGGGVGTGAGDGDHGAPDGIMAFAQYAATNGSFVPHEWTNTADTQAGAL